LTVALERESVHPVSVFSATDVADLATPAEYVTAVREGYRQRGDGAPARPRSVLTSESPPGLVTEYTAILPETGVAGGYLYTAGFESEDAWFVTVLFDADAGYPIALFDGSTMNPLKTGAAGAVGVDALARSDASRLGIVGSGSQARGQLLATATVRDLEDVVVYSPTAEHREAFARSMDERLDARVRAVDSSREAVEDRDVVVTATTASDPVFDGDWLDPGTHVTAMGQYHPSKRELDVRTIERSTYVPDLRERVERDAGAFIAARERGLVDDDHVHAELGEVVAGMAVGRPSPEAITVFDSGGTGIETVAAGAMLVERAAADGRGQTIPFTPASEGFELTVGDRSG
jgi:alanine dehydrogenase